MTTTRWCTGRAAIGPPPQDVTTCVDRSGASPIEARILGRIKLDGDENDEPGCRRRWVTSMPRQSDALEPCARLCDLSDDDILDIPMSGEDDDRGDGAVLTGRRRSCAAGTAKDVASWVLRRLLPTCGGQCAQPYGSGDASWATGRIGMVRLRDVRRGGGKDTLAEGGHDAKPAPKAAVRTNKLKAKRAGREKGAPKDGGGKDGDADQDLAGEGDEGDDVMPEGVVENEAPVLSEALTGGWDQPVEEAQGTMVATTPH